MALSSDLLSQFVKVTNDNSKEKKETTNVYGTVTDAGEQKYVKFDGSDITTPVSTTVDVSEGDRVIVMIKNHSAVITGNLNDPSASSSSASNASDQITDLGVAVANRVTTDQLNAMKANITQELLANDVIVRDTLQASIVDVEKRLTAVDVDIKGKLEADEADITDLQTNKLSAEDARLTYATIENLEATDAEINSLKGTYAEFEKTATDKLTAIDADIDELNTKKLDADTAEITYANIDFSNISKATMAWFYANSGLIENVVVGDGTITGNLVGVTIKGDLIEGNTVKADKLVILGTDGLYYKLNTNGVTTEAEQTDQNSLNGSIITAKSITASKVNVSDLVAFDATIGGFHITEGSLYSGAKTTVDNNTSGIYLDSTGQMAVGDGSNYIKYFKDSEGNYKLAISAESIIFAASGESVEDAIGNVREAADTADEKADYAQTLVQQLTDNISMLVTDGNGTSLMTQTETGWMFSTAEIQTAIASAAEGLDSLTNELGDTNNTVDILQQAVDDLGEIAEYVKIGTYEDEPCIELGEGDSDFKLRITNTQIMFMEGSSIVAYVNNQSLYIKKAVVEEELQQGGFVWKVRSNGNMGLIWKGGI